jgi:putative metalloprotease
MNDDEQRWLLGHQIGHVKLGHALASFKGAYMNRAARMRGETQADGDRAPTPTEFAALAEAAVIAPNLLAEEYEADVYGLAFMKRYRYKAHAGVSALEKLADLNGSAAIIATHPGSFQRSRNLRDELAVGHAKTPPAS